MGQSGDPSAYARKEQQQRENRIRTGVSLIGRRFAGFDPAFYSQRAKEYYNYAMPQFGQQYVNTRNQILYNLANRGLLGSGAMRGMANRFSLTANTQKQGLADAGVELAQNLRNKVEQSRTNLISQLQTSADPALASQQALAAASGFSAPSVFQPIGNLFQDFSNMFLAKQQARAWAPVQQYAMQMLSGGLSNKTYNPVE